MQCLFQRSPEPGRRGDSANASFAAPWRAERASAARGGLIRARKRRAPRVSRGLMLRNLSAEPGGVETSRCHQLKGRERISLLSERSELSFWPGADSRRHPQLRPERGKAGTSLHRTPAPWW